MREDEPIQGTPLCSQVTDHFVSAAITMREALLWRVFSGGGGGGSNGRHLGSVGSGVVGG